MRTLALKLTLAFLVVGLIGAVLIAIFVSQRTQREFDQFIADRSQLELVDKLAGYYETHNGWQGLGAITFQMRRRSGMLERILAPVTLVDADRTVIYSRQHYRVGQQLSPNEIRRNLPIEVNGEVVGMLLYDAPSVWRPPPDSPEIDFLRRVNQAIIFGALGATALALLLGILLARNISRPITELTAATQAIAAGKLGQQVPVRTRDELGELAISFNRMSADLARANNLRRQMTADIAHELRTPLSIILGYTEALSDGKLRGAPAMYETMHNEARLLSHLIDDLRTLSLADAGELTMNLQTCSPQAMLERTATAYATQAQKQDVALAVQASPDLPALRVDPDRMAQVLNNLVSNALRYTPAGGQITLSAEASDDSVLLRVADTGAGILPDVLPHIFERFYRADESRWQNGESGLGLAIAKSIIEAHGASIDVESLPGRGTTFTIRWLAA